MIEISIDRGVDHPIRLLRSDDSFEHRHGRTERRGGLELAADLEQELGGRGLPVNDIGEVVAMGGGADAPSVVFT